MEEYGNIISDFLDNYFKLEVDGNKWVIRNLLDNNLDLEKMLNEIYIIFGKSQENRAILYKWVSDKKAKLVKPVVTYLDTFEVTIGDKGWDIKHKQTSEDFYITNLYNTFNPNYNNDILTTILDEWLYIQKTMC